MGTWSNLTPGASVALGIIVGLLSTCIQSVGLTLQRKSHMLEDLHYALHDRRPAYRRRRWQVGMFLFLLANIVGSSIQITTLPLPLLSTLQASGLVFNSLLASLLLKEPWTWRTGCGTFLVAGGAVLISLFSALPEPSHSLTQLIELLGRRTFLAWFILSLLLVLGLLAMDFAMRKVVSEKQRDSPRLSIIRGMSYGAISGILSAHALLLAKSAVELIVRSLVDKKNQFSNYRSWLLLLAFLILALSQLYYLHLGLRLISTTILYPFVFCIYNIVAILDGLIYFRQMDRLPPLHAGLIALGTVVLLAGVLALSWRFQDVDDDDMTPNEHEHVHPKHEFPQTVLTPGSGFVADPPDTDETESALADDDDEEEGTDEDGYHPVAAAPVSQEQRPLLDYQKSLVTTRAGRKSRSSNRSSSLNTTHTNPNLRSKRRRAATLREVLDIWEELGDDHDHRQSGQEDQIRDGDGAGGGEGAARYGTFASDHAAAADEGRRAASHPHPSRHSHPHPPIYHLPNGQDHDADDHRRLLSPDLSPENDHIPRPRARTLPTPHTLPSSSGRQSRRRRGRRRRSTNEGGGGSAGGALFSDLLSWGWWRRRNLNDEDEGGHQGGRRRRRSSGGDGL
ncbi:hypothetical protein KC318_g12544 [Hortaea werneckii]|uniref:Uncharacterized protein n=1 Tax=Hortaea werneckii TaxID=91943 RepID=A0A3M7AX82_HORWE|nr:hypothetical protein KC334_g1378 [Hortaea werneckii]KAI7002721.1 hypothetical protein KC355_g9626 [Hortaea werneckii]KAI7656209.1 hypothetical protein KC318_g12544 [Hortaea werneckii]RMY16238.1 hypothetical protein D0867_06586 [Hortaea werneckii]RMY32066.1 hypothetical protein D0866_06867 [Hortaea werneckii]